MPRDDKTEKATPKRRGEARKKGQVAKSPDLAGGAVVIAGLIALSWVAPAAITTIAGSMRDAFTHIAHSGDITTSAGLQNLLMTVLEHARVARSDRSPACASRSASSRTSRRSGSGRR